LEVTAALEKCTQTHVVCAQREREREKCAAHFCSDPSSAETERENINEEGGRQAGRQASKQAGRQAGRPAGANPCLLAAAKRRECA